MWVNVEIKKMCKTGRFRAKPDPGQFLSGKKFEPKNFSSIVDFKNEVFGKPDFGQKNRTRTSGKHQGQLGFRKGIILNVFLPSNRKNVKNRTFWIKTGNRTDFVREIFF